MVKTCREIAKEIDELRKTLQQNKLLEMSMVSLSDRKKCESNNATVMCTNCNCWKSAKEYCS